MSQIDAARSLTTDDRLALVLQAVHRVERSPDLEDLADHLDARFAQMATAITELAEELEHVLEGNEALRRELKQFALAPAEPPPALESGRVTAELVHLVHASRPQSEVADQVRNLARTVGDECRRWWRKPR